MVNVEMTKSQYIEFCMKSLNKEISNVAKFGLSSLNAINKLKMTMLQEELARALEEESNKELKE